MKKKFLIKIKMHFCENYSTIEPHFSHIDMHKKAMYICNCTSYWNVLNWV